MFTESSGQPARSFFGNLLNRAKSAFSRWREVSRCDPQEIAAVARDLNLSPGELVSLMCGPFDSLESLEKRLACAGLSQEALAASQPDELRDLRRVCSLCSEKARCARDIRHQRMAIPSRYCPNELTLQALTSEASQVRPEGRGSPMKLS